MSGIRDFEILAFDTAAVYNTGDHEALARINRHFGSAATVDDLRANVWRHVYKVRQGGGGNPFTLADAQEYTARLAGYGQYSSLRTFW